MNDKNFKYVYFNPNFDFVPKETSEFSPGKIQIYLKSFVIRFFNL